MSMASQRLVGLPNAEVAALPVVVGQWIGGRDAVVVGRGELVEAAVGVVQRGRGWGLQRQLDDAAELVS